MKVVFRADASLAIGSGHVMRCLTLADALREAGAEILFVCRAHTCHLGDLIQARGHRVILLPREAETSQPLSGPKHVDWLGTDGATDAARCKVAMESFGDIDLLVVDHYGLDATFERALRPVTRRIAVIDDLADRPHDCDLLIDQNLGAEKGRYNRLVRAGTDLLMGPHFAMIDPAFVLSRRARTGEIGRILVFFGNVDVGNASRAALEAIEQMRSENIGVDLIVGCLNPHRSKLLAFASNRPWINVLPQQLSLVNLVAAADLAIGAGGVAAMERAAAGLPAIVVAVAENQIGPAQGLAASDGAIFLGMQNVQTAKLIATTLGQLKKSPDTVFRMGQAAAALCDGRGLARVVRRLVTVPIVLRRATNKDAEKTWSWRNHPETRKWSRDPGEISLERHVAWFAETLKRKNRDLFIASCKGIDIGTLRFDYESDHAVISIYLDPLRTGQGLGRLLLLAGIQHIKKARTEIQRLEAVIKPDNHVSRNAFAAAGFYEEGTLFFFHMSSDKAGHVNR